MRYSLKYVITISVVLLFISCKNNKITLPEKPKNLISEEVMANIIYDMSIFTAAKGINKKTIESYGVTPTEAIFNKYGIDSVQFAKSNEYYSYNIETYENIFQTVHKKIEDNKVVIDSLIQIDVEKRKQKGNEQRKKRDSLRKMKSIEGGRTLEPKSNFDRS